MDRVILELELRPLETSPQAARAPSPRGEGAGEPAQLSAGPGVEEGHPHVSGSLDVRLAASMVHARADVGSGAEPSHTLFKPYPVENGWQILFDVTPEPFLPAEANTAITVRASSPVGEMSISLTAKAFAYGDFTSAFGELFNVVQDIDGIYIAHGWASFNASALSFDGGLPVAKVSIALDIAGADFIFTTIEKGAEYSAVHALATADLHFLAIDIPNWTPAGGPVRLDYAQIWTTLPVLRLPIGTMAAVDAFAQAIGQNTIAHTMTNAISITNQYSAVDAQAYTAIL
jgi:hypothetical protein